MTHWDELERELRLSVHPTFADRLLDNALESDNMLGAYGEIVDLVATLRAPATAGELGSQAEAVAEMSKVLRSGPGGPATGVVMTSKKAMAVAAAAASLATGSAFAAGLPAAVQDLATNVSAALVGLVDGGGAQSVAEAQGAPEAAPPARGHQGLPEPTPVVDAGGTAAPETAIPPAPEQSEAVEIAYNPPAGARDEPEPAREPRAREAAVPVGAGAGPLNPDDGASEPPAAGRDGEPAPPAEEPPVIAPETPSSPSLDSGADSQLPSPFAPPFVPVGDGNADSATPPPADDTGSDQQGDDTAGDEDQDDDDQGGTGDDQGSTGNDQGDNQGGQGDDGSAGGDNGQGGDGGSSGGDTGGDQGGGDQGGGDPGQGGDGGQGGSDPGQGDQGCQSNGNGNPNGNADPNGNANGHCKHEDGDDPNHGGGNG